MSSARFAPTPGTVADRLRRRLLALSYPDFARCVCALLETLGYEDARPAGRSAWKGYNRPGGGGYDIEASLSGGLAPRRVVGQIKQFDGLNVHQRSVDELRGACLRAQASEALLVTTSAFSDVVRKQAASPEPIGGLIAPVRLIDGKELLALLIRRRVGVRERGPSRQGRGGLELDEEFFARMVGPETAPGPRAALLERQSRRTLPGWRVTVQILPPPCPRGKRREQAERTERIDTEERSDTEGGR